MINDQQHVKLEPREQVASPYLVYPGNYRETSQATPSPQPLSPPMFVQVSPSPSPYNNIGNILQNQLQTPRATPVTMNNFQQQPHTNQNYTPNIQPTTAAPFTNGNNSIWPNNLSGTDPSASRAFVNNSLSVTPSAIFNQPLTPLPNIAPNFNITTEQPMATSSNFLDLDNQFLIDNLSGDLQSLNFSDFAMDSFQKTGEKSINK